MTQFTTELTPAEFDQQAALLAMEIVTTVLRPKAPLRTTVVMEALVRLYRYHAKQLPAVAQADCAFALGQMASELLAASANSQPSAPPGAPVH